MGLMNERNELIILIYIVFFTAEPSVRCIANTH